jgi:hypothetical protein
MAIVLFPSSKLYDYDQQSPPSSPSTNQTWLERNASGVPVGQWFWNGTYWLTLQDYVRAFSMANILGGGGGLDFNTNQYITMTLTSSHTLSPVHHQGVFVVGGELELVRISGTHDASNYYQAQIYFQSLSSPSGVPTSSVTGAVTSSIIQLITTGTSTTFTFSINAFSNFANTLLRATIGVTAGSPGPMSLYGGFLYKGVRR